MRFKTGLRAGIFFLAAAPLLAQAPKEITVSWCYSDEGEAVGKTPKTYWTAGDDVLLLDETRPAAARRLERVRPAGDRQSAFDGAKAMASLKAILAAAPEALPWPDSFDLAGRRAVYVIADGLFLLDLSTSNFERIGRAGEKISVARLSPDGSKVAFVRASDLWVYDVASKAETRLTCLLYTSPSPRD